MKKQFSILFSMSALLGSVYAQSTTSSFELALGIDGLDIIHGGDQEWQVVSNPSGDSTGVIASPASLEDEEQSSFALNGLNAEIVTFRWKVSSEAGRDRFYVNHGGKVPQEWLASIDGNVDYGVVGLKLDPDRSNTLNWTYAKDSFGSQGDDRGFVDQLELHSSGNLFMDDPDGSPGGVKQQAGMNFVPRFDGRTIWVPVVDELNPENRALKASSIGGGQNVTMSYYTAAYDNESVLGFDYRVSSEAGNDVLEVLVNGLLASGVVDGTPVSGLAISGETGAWKRATVPLLANRRNFIQIMYRKNATVNEGDDTAWLDNITITDLILPVSTNPFFDADDDGYSDFEEYAFGGDINVPGGLRNLPVVLADADGMTLSVPLDPNVSGVEYELQSSTNLTDWDPVQLPQTVSKRADGVDVYELSLAADPDEPATYYRLLARPEAQ